MWSLIPLGAELLGLTGSDPQQVIVQEKEDNTALYLISGLAAVLIIITAIILTRQN